MRFLKTKNYALESSSCGAAALLLQTSRFGTELTVVSVAAAIYISAVCRLLTIMGATYAVVCVLFFHCALGFLPKSIGMLYPLTTACSIHTYTHATCVRNGVTRCCCCESGAGGLVIVIVSKYTLLQSGNRRILEAERS